MSERRPSWLLCVGLLAVGCAASRPIAGEWRNVTKVVDVPPGELTITLHANGTGNIELPDGYFWWFRSFLWTRENVNNREGVLSLHDEEKDKKGTPMRLSFTFTEDGDLVLYPLKAKEASKPDNPDQRDRLVFRRG